QPRYQHNQTNSNITIGNHSSFQQNAPIYNIQEQYNFNSKTKDEQTVAKQINNIPSICGSFQKRSIVQPLSLSSQGIRHLALTGISGSGKSELAKDLVHGYQAQYHTADKLTLAWWLDATTDENLKLSWEDLSVACGSLPRDKTEPFEEYWKRANRLIIEQLRCRSDWILVFDDVQSLVQITSY